MKKFGKVLFAGLVLAAMVLAASCSMNVRSGLAGKNFKNTTLGSADDGSYMAMEFGKKDQLKFIYHMESSGHYMEITLSGTYNCTSKETVEFKLTTLDKAVEDGIDCTSLVPADEVAMFSEYYNGTYSFTLDGNTLTIWTADEPDYKVTFTRY